MAADIKRTAHLPEWKIKEVQDLVEKISQSRVIGVVGLRDIPASDLQQMRGELRANVEIKVVRNTVAKRALKGSAPEIEPLTDLVEDQTALIFSDENPFKLYNILQKSKRPMLLKLGSKSPKDIMIEPGETSFSPGPMVGKLQSAGIPAAIKGGKVVVTQHVTLIREGEIVSAKVAEILKDMDIFPRNVGLDLRGAYEEGLIFQAKDLSLNLDELLSQFGSASANAFNLAIEVGYATSQTVAHMLQIAQAKARGLVVELGIPVPDVMEYVLLKAAANARAVSSLVMGAKTSTTVPSGSAVHSSSEKEDSEVKKKDTEEVAVVEGLGALFGQKEVDLK
ncbi:MAG: 50S ribosomal protein L10 [Methanotrichaceae archaeon]|nr:50S ribosomal protein L10 [Methanotrichaceae archaeon]